MTFKEFGDVVYSEDQSAYFVRYTDTAVKKQDHKMKTLRYSVGKYGGANKFRDACLAKCAGEEKCGGVVFQYHGTDKGTPKQCAFKGLEPTTKTNKKKKKDFYRRVCYGGGPGGYPMPDTGDDNETACKMFGKTLVKTATGTIVAPTTCNDGDPYTKANDQACQAAGKTACWGNGISPDTQFSPWIVGKRRTTFLTGEEFSDCFRVCAINNLCYPNAPPVTLTKDYQCLLNGYAEYLADMIIAFTPLRYLATMSACN